MWKSKRVSMVWVRENRTKSTGHLSTLFMTEYTSTSIALYVWYLWVDFFFLIFRQVVYGENSIEVEVKSYWRLFIEEVILLKWKCYSFFLADNFHVRLTFNWLTEWSIYMLILQVMNPFYVFQIASIILWLCDQYYYYAACILFISLMSIGISLYETKRVSI